MKTKPYDYLLVGAGLYNAVLAYRLRQQGKRCLVTDVARMLVAIFTQKSL